MKNKTSVSSYQQPEYVRHSVFGIGQIVSTHSGSAIGVKFIDFGSVKEVFRPHVTPVTEADYMAAARSVLRLGEAHEQHEDLAPR